MIVDGLYAYILIALCFALGCLVVYRGLKFWLFEAILLVLLLPLSYQGCFDSCAWVIAPFMVPGFHWVDWISPLIYLLEFGLLLKVLDYFKQKYNKSDLSWRSIKCIFVGVLWVLMILLGRFQSAGVAKVVYSISSKIDHQQAVSDAEEKKPFYDKFDLGADESNFYDEDFDRVADDIIVSLLPDREFLEFYIPNKSGSMGGGMVDYTSEDQVVEKILNNMESIHPRGLPIHFDRCYINGINSGDIFCFNNNRLELKTYDGRPIYSIGLFEMNSELVR